MKSHSRTTLEGGDTCMYVYITWAISVLSNMYDSYWAICMIHIGAITDTGKLLAEHTLHRSYLL